MEESEFWLRLESRICAEFAGFNDRHLRWYGCDGLIAEEYDLLREQPCIRGRAWCGPDGQEPWTFVLHVHPATRRREDIDWSALLPDDRLTGWLTPDPTNRRMNLDPLSGYSD